MFQKGSLGKLVKNNAYSIDKSVQSYKLDNDIFYKYYELQPVIISKKIGKDVHNETTKSTNQKGNRKRILKREEMLPENILSDKRIRKKPIWSKTIFKHNNK